MREILFRGKREDNGEWAYGLYVLFGGKSIIMLSDTTELRPSEIFGLNELYEYPVIHEVDPDTVGQFTGLLDKNGNKIFEGDILHGLYGDMLVYFGEIIGYGMGFMWKPVIEDGKWESITGFVDEYEVIGNKWDNPELLEGGVE